MNESLGVVKTIIPFVKLILQRPVDELQAFYMTLKI